MGRSNQNPRNKAMRTISKFLCIISLMLIPQTALGTRGKVVRPFEQEGELISVNPIDGLVSARLEKSNIKPANLCSDVVFIRRVYLDTLGILPDGLDVRQFLRDNRPDKRSVLIEELLNKREEFARYWSLKWCDILRVKSEYPINLWPNAVQAYHRWIYDALKQNMPYHKLARELLTASGSNFRVPQVNFYRAIQGQNKSAIAAAAALTFMGVRLEKWPREKSENLEAFFSRVAYKKTAEWKEEIVYLDPSASEPLTAVFPDGRKVDIGPEQDPREVFADWLIRSGNPYFARNIVNRLWYWLMGRGIIHEPDDIRLDNPASNPELLTWLEKELVKSRYDLRHIYRLILNSRTYQQSSIPQSDDPQAESLFAYYPVRQLDAEVLIDAICKITSTQESYQSPIPEPFAFIPSQQHSIELADGSITSPFLEMFGRPGRDTGLESQRSNQPTDEQRLHMLNSTNIQRKIENSQRLREMVKIAKGKRPMIIDILYMNVLSRSPTPAETAASLEYFKTDGITPPQAINDITWALMNTKEFLYKH